jgi:hypothetical protein
MSRLGLSEETAKVWICEDRKWSAAEALQRGFVDCIDTPISLVRKINVDHRIRRLRMSYRRKLVTVGIGKAAYRGGA